MSQPRNPGSADTARNAIVAAAADRVSVTDKLSDMAVKNPAPDSSPSREPSGTYRIIAASR